MITGLVRERGGVRCGRVEIGAGFEDPLGNQLGCIHVNTSREFLFVSKMGQKGQLPGTHHSEKKRKATTEGIGENDLLAETFN